MKSRRFDPVTVPAENGRRRVHRFTCSGCGVIWDVSANTWGGARAIEDIERQAKRCGWRLGRRPDHDVCGACESARRASGRGQHLRLIETEEQPMSTPAPKAEAPREMSRVDRRVINAKLEEVYLDETVGYAKGWSDIKVAEDLGVPRAWVETLREESFGPHGEAEEGRAVREGIEAVAAEIKALNASFSEFRGEHVKRLTMLDGKLNDLKQAARASGVRL